MRARLHGIPATLALVAVNFGVFGAQLARGDVGGQLRLEGGWSGIAERPWTPLSVFVLHEAVLHLALMMVLLVAFGGLLERATSSLHVLGVYVACGLVGSFVLASVASLLDREEAAVGSSAAVLGVAAAAIVLRPDTRVLAGRAQQWLIVFVVVNLVLLVPSPLGSAAHLAGIAVGAAAGYALERSRRVQDAPRNDSPRRVKRVSGSNADQPH
jgi:membrane associated rhomboid family serine protease